MRHLMAPALFAGLVTALAPDCPWRERAEPLRLASAALSVLTVGRSLLAPGRAWGGRGPSIRGLDY